ncbi:MAG: RIP metalloprotease RseP [Candidatus Eisenbacteria sp.]|nr:RIP metalloprotease RseP [Candidatus Eisenbacteria bacterium]
MLTILSFIVVLGIIVFFHELGHFLAAKSVGIRVEQFSLGYPPKMISVKYGETDYRISWIPLGGYTKMSGMIDESDGGKSTLTGAPWEFASKNPLQKLWVIVAGVLMNFVLAMLLYTGITAVKGIPEPSSAAFIGGVAPGMPADMAGLQVGDCITGIGGEAVGTWDELIDGIHPRVEEEILVSYEREGKAAHVTLTTKRHEIEVNGEWQEVGLIGISARFDFRPATVEEVLLSGVVGTVRVIGLVGGSIKMLVTGRASVKDLGGPVLIAKMSGDSAREGAAHFLSFIAFISVNIGCLNLLPIPALDGGHAVIILGEAIIRRELPTKIKLGLQYAGMLFLMCLILFIVWNDVQRVFGLEWIKGLF